MCLEKVVPIPCEASKGNFVVCYCSCFVKQQCNHCQDLLLAQCFRCNVNKGWCVDCGPRCCYEGGDPDDCWTLWEDVSSKEQLDFVDGMR